MRSMKLLTAVVAGLAMQVLPTIANAQEVDVRLEPGVAIPLTKPQSSWFLPGLDVAIKPELTIEHYVGVGPSISTTVLAMNSSKEVGTATMLGGFVRLKRPHDFVSNTSSGFSAISPWVEGDLGYVRTGPLNRFGWSAQVGAALPITTDRSFWLGPFAEYKSVFQDGPAGPNTNDAKILVVGLSLEFDGAQSKPIVVQPKPVPVVEPPPIVVEVVPVPTTVTETVEHTQVIQFAWDSPVLDGAATAALTEVAANFRAAKEYDHIKIEGHASSEGQVEHNNKLSLARAQSVLDFLVANGVPREKLAASGFGSRVPVATNKTEAGRRLNRRVDFNVKFVVVKTVKQ